MIKSNVSAFLLVLFGAGLCLSGFAQTDKYPYYTFTKKDGTSVEASVRLYSTSSGRVTVRTKEGTDHDFMFDEISPENQEILLDMKMDQIVDSSRFEVDYKRDRESTEEKMKGNIKKEIVPIKHTLTLTNKERIPIKDLTVVYAVAYERTGVAGRSFAGSSDDGLGFYFEELPAVEVPAKDSVTIETPTFELKTLEDTYAGGRDGGRGTDYADAGGKLKEEYKGVVFRFFRNGEMIREEASPSSLAKRDFTIRPANAPAKPVE